jgi:hypothetical protein
MEEGLLEKKVEKEAATLTVSGMVNPKLDPGVYTFHTHVLSPVIISGMHMAARCELI